MLDNFYTLRAISQDLNTRLRGVRMGQPFSQEKDELVIPFPAHHAVLLVSCNPGSMACFLHRSFARARKNTADVLPGTAGSRITKVFIHPADRIIEMSLDDPAGTLMLRFFNGKENALLLDTSRRVVDSFRNARRTVGELLPTPEDAPPEGPPSLEHLAVEFSGQSVSTALRKSFPRLGPPLTNEILARAGVAPDTPVAALLPSDVRSVTLMLDRVRTELDHPAPRVYHPDNWSTVRMSIIALSHLREWQEASYDDIHEAARVTFTRRRASAAFQQTRQAITTTLESHLLRARRNLEASARQAGGASRADDYERMGHLVLAHLHDITRGMTELVTDRGTVELDPSVPPAASAQRYFEKAKKARTAERESATRRAALGSRIAAGERLLKLLAATESSDQIRTLMKDNATMFDEFGLGPDSRDRAELPFRMFVVDGGFEVWAGKDSRSNDLLTLRHTRPDDLWFHARGAGGSHVVLRVGSAPGEPGKRAQEQAASIAAYYSKMRNAGTVPVAVTLRKYVRKPRGAPAGTVVLERERVLFARPGLPAGSSRPSRS